METSFLRTFVLVAETGSMAEAARRLDLTPTSVAQQIRALEKELGLTLLARAGRTVQPTDAGHELIEEARGVVRAAERLREQAAAGSTTATLRLGCIHTALHSVVPDMLQRMVQLQPLLNIWIEHNASMALYEAVQRGELDAAICIHPQFAVPKVFGWRTLRKERLVVLGPARAEGRDPHELLAQEPFIRYARTQWGGKQAERYLRAADIRPHERFELSSLTAIAMMVDRGLGVSLVPDASLPLPAGLQIVKIALPKAVEARHVGVLWVRASPRVRTIRLLLQVLSDQGAGDAGAVHKGRTAG